MIAPTITHTNGHDRQTESSRTMAMSSKRHFISCPHSDYVCQSEFWGRCSWLSSHL